jgi:hypothetical protein
LVAKGGRSLFSPWKNCPQLFLRHRLAAGALRFFVEFAQPKAGFSRQQLLVSGSDLWQNTPNIKLTQLFYSPPSGRIWPGRHRRGTGGFLACALGFSPAKGEKQVAKVKGTVFGPRLEFIRKKGTPAELQQIMDLLSPEFRDLIARHIMSSQWYPFEYYVELNRALVKVLGRGQEDILCDVGYYSADVSLNGIYKTFFRVGTPGFIIKAATKAWGQYFQNGDLKVDVHTSRSLTMNFTGIELLSREHFISTAGWVKKVLELSGAKTVKALIGKFSPVLVTLEVSWE